MLRPGFLRGLNASVDYYDIRIGDAIATLGAPTLAQGCFAGNQLLCQSISFNPDGSIAFITNTRLNLAQAATRGIDFELNYARPHFLGGKLSTRLLATRVLKLESTTPAGVQDRLGQVSNFNRTLGVPKWTADAFADYKRGPLRLGLQARLVGAGKFSTILHEGSGGRFGQRQHVPAFVYVTASGAYRFESSGRRSAELFAVVNNLVRHRPADDSVRRRRRDQREQHQRPVLRRRRPLLPRRRALQPLDSEESDMILCASVERGRRHQRARRPDHPRRAYRHRRKSFSTAHAAAVRDGKFIAVGSDAEVMRTAGPNTRVIDLHGERCCPASTTRMST